jgi:hypothetical protein
MAVGADDIALGQFVLQPCLGSEHCPTRRQPKQFGRRIPVVEVHLMGLEGSPAIGAGSATNIPQERQSGILSLADSRNLRLTIPRVVQDVVWPLIPKRSHRTAC